MIKIVTGDPRPIFRQIVDGIRMKVASGALPTGARLPSVRGLAIQLTVNANTVAKAYAELTNEGLIESRPGIGVFVGAPRQRLSDTERQRRLDEAVQQLVHSVVALDLPVAEIVDRVATALEVLANAKRHPSR